MLIDALQILGCLTYAHRLGCFLPVGIITMGIHIAFGFDAAQVEGLKCGRGEALVDVAEASDDSAYIALVQITGQLPELMLYLTGHVASVFALQIPHKLTLQGGHTLACLPFGRAAAVVRLWNENTRLGDD